jgi:hypothetical protein
MKVTCTLEFDSLAEMLAHFTYKAVETTAPANPVAPPRNKRVKVEADEVTMEDIEEAQADDATSFYDEPEAEAEDTPAPKVDRMAKARAAKTAKASKPDPRALINAAKDKLAANYSRAEVRDAVNKLLDKYIPSGAKRNFNAVPDGVAEEFSAEVEALMDSIA